MNTTKESRRKTREDLFGRPVAALLDIANDNESQEDDFEDPEEEF